MRSREELAALRRQQTQARARERAARESLKERLKAYGDRDDVKLNITERTKSAVVKGSALTCFGARRYHINTFKEKNPGEVVPLQIKQVCEAGKPGSTFRAVMLDCVDDLHGQRVVLTAILLPDEPNYVRMVPLVAKRPLFVGYEDRNYTLSWELPEEYTDWEDFMKQAWEQGSDKPQLVCGMAIPKVPRSVPQVASTTSQMPTAPRDLTGS